MSDKGYLVVIEWDGEKPPTPFYHRVRRLTSGVRQDDDEEARSLSPITRRSNRNDNAVVMQEGAIYCVSRSLARALAILAESYGAANVEIATVSKMSPIVATKSDLEALSKINKILGRRGRPPHRSWRTLTLNCFEEVMSYRISTDKEIVNCPECGSLATSIHYGHPSMNQESDSDFRMRYQDGKVGLFERWAILRSVHRTGISFFPIQDKEEGLNYPFDRAVDVWQKRKSMISERLSEFGINPNFRMTREFPEDQKRILTGMINSDFDYLDALWDTPHDYVRILDAIFVNAYTLDDDERLEGRLSALSIALMRYPDIAKKYMLTISDTEYDIFDASPIIPAKEVVDYFAFIRENSKEPEFA